MPVRIGRGSALANLASAAVLVVALGSAAAVAGPYEDAVASFQRGDFATALRQLLPLAAQGNTNAQYVLGMMYDDGLGVPPDSREAVRWYTKAAEEGNAWAQYNLGAKYTAGNGVPLSYQEAAKWTAKAAAQGHAGAERSLGVMYANGRGVPQDYSEAVKWFRRAAQQGNTNAQNNLGVMYDSGRGVPQDYVRAHMWFNLSAAAAADDNSKSATINRNRVAAKMTQAQIDQAQEMARRCQASSYKQCD
jgi:TPR repeat protein